MLQHTPKSVGEQDLMGSVHRLMFCSPFCSPFLPHIGTHLGIRVFDVIPHITDHEAENQFQFSWDDSPSMVLPHSGLLPETIISAVLNDPLGIHPDSS